MSQSADLVALDRERVRRYGFPEFARLALPIVEPAIAIFWDWHLDEMANHAQALVDGRTRMLAVNVPPGHTKSLLMSCLVQAWSWTRDPSLRWICTGFKADDVYANAQKTLDLIASPWFVARWGSLVKDAHKIGDYKIKGGGGRLSRAMGHGLTGRHGDIISIDDPLKADHAFKSDKDTAKAVLNAERIIAQSVSTRKTGEDTRLMLTMQRLHEQDPTSWFIAQGADHLRLPMLFEPGARCVTRFGGDRRKVRDEILAASRFSRAHVEAEFRRLGGRGSPGAEAQLQQNPTPPGGNIFKREHLLKRFAGSVEEFKRELSVLSIDPSFKAKKESDPIAVEVWSFNVGHMRCWLSDTTQRGFLDSVNFIGATLRQWPCTYVLIEDTANGSAILDSLGPNGLGLSNLVAVGPKGGKEARARAASVHAQAGALEFLEADWTAAKLDNMARFPSSDDHDVDTTSQAVLWMAAEFGISAAFGDAMVAWGEEKRLGGANPRSTFAKLFSLTR